jgi:hypothetical protein
MAWINKPVPYMHITVNTEDEGLAILQAFRPSLGLRVCHNFFVIQGCFRLYALVYNML